MTQTTIDLAIPVAPTKAIPTLEKDANRCSFRFPPSVAGSSS